MLQALSSCARAQFLACYIEKPRSVLNTAQRQRGCQNKDHWKFHGIVLAFYPMREAGKGVYEGKTMWLASWGITGHLTISIGNSGVWTWGESTCADHYISGWRMRQPKTQIWQACVSDYLDSSLRQPSLFAECPQHAGHAAIALSDVTQAAFLASSARKLD